MKNQAYRMAMLYDFYGDLLTPRQKEFYDLYYNDDLSLAEIAENYDITRQGCLLYTSGFFDERLVCT